MVTVNSFLGPQQQQVRNQMQPHSGQNSQGTTSNHSDQNSSGEVRSAFVPQSEWLLQSLNITIKI